MVTDEFKLQLFGKDLFEELLDLFPSTVIRPDGKKEYLKTDLRRSKSKYKTITNDQVDIHNHIMQCLALEIATRTANNSMKYFRRIFNWLNTEGWKEFENNLSDKTIELTDGYGTDII